MNNPEKKVKRDIFRSRELAARFDYVEAEELAELRERVGGEIAYYMEKGTHWYIHRGDLVIDGDLDHDMSWIIDGDLFVHGVYNDYLSGSGHLLCLGTAHAKHWLSWNACTIEGDLVVFGLIAGVYNDYPFEVYGKSIEAFGVVMSDKFYSLPEEMKVEFFVSEGESVEDAVWADNLYSEVVEWLDEEGNTIPTDIAKEKRNAGKALCARLVDFGILGELARAEHLIAGTALQKVTHRRALLGELIDEKLLEDALGDITLHLDLAYAHVCPVEAMHMLSKSSDPRVRRAIACQPEAPTELLRNLSQDKNAHVRAALAYNPKITLLDKGSILSMLASDKNAMVRRAVAASLNAEKYIQQLIQDSDMSVRRALASHPALSMDERRLLVMDKELAVKRRAIYYLPVLPELVKEFLLSEDENLRRWAERHAE